MKKALIALFFAALFSIHAFAGEYSWYKGNIHCHTLQSDGTAPPEFVVKWYRDNGYNFLIITDHNKLTVPDCSDTDKFLLMPGEEVSDGFGKRPLHVNGLNISKVVVPAHGAGISETLQNDINAIREAGGIAQLNHPLWRWAFDEKSIAPLKGVSLLEVCNNNRECNNVSAGKSTGMEGIWDRLLSLGRVFYATASDDAHSYEGIHKPYASYPGTAWIMVKAPALTPENIIQSLLNGSFYATTGVILKDVSTSKREYSLEIETKDDYQYTTYFIGNDGKILSAVTGEEASYSFTGSELYVRARIVSTGGEFALTQPCFPKSR